MRAVSFPAGDGAAIGGEGNPSTRERTAVDPLPGPCGPPGMTRRLSLGLGRTRDSACLPSGNTWRLCIFRTARCLALLPIPARLGGRDGSRDCRFLPAVGCRTWIIRTHDRHDRNVCAADRQAILHRPSHRRFGGESARHQHVPALDARNGAGARGRFHHHPADPVPLSRRHGDRPIDHRAAVRSIRTAPGAADRSQHLRRGVADLSHGAECERPDLRSCRAGHGRLCGHHLEPGHRSRSYTGAIRSRA